MIEDSANTLASSGLGFYYMDDTSPSWSMSNVGINELHGHAVFNTLQQIYTAKDVSIDTRVVAGGNLQDIKPS